MPLVLAAARFLAALSWAILNKPPDVVAAVGGGEQLAEARPGGVEQREQTWHCKLKYADETKATSASSDCEPLSTAWPMLVTTLISQLLQAS